MNLRSSIGLLFALTLSLVFTDTAGAQPPRPDVIHVEYWYHTGCTSPCAPTAYCEELYDSGQSIVVEVNSCLRRVNIWADDPDEHDIGAVSIERVSPGATLPSYLEIFIGQGDFPYLMGQSAAAARDLCCIGFGNDNALRGVTRFAGHITGDLLGPTNVGRIYRLDVDGVLVGGLSAAISPAAEELFRVFAGSTSIFGIGATSGTITRIDVQGTLAGTIEALDEGIGDIIAGTLRATIKGGDFIRNIEVAGAIATSAGGPVLITTTEPGAPIETITAASINADIEAGTSTSRGNVTRVQAASGNLAGSIKALNLTGTSSGVPGIEVSGSLSSTVTLASGGLQRQIIVNGGNSGGTWTGGVTIGSTTLSGLYYTNTSSSLGGGSVGLAPFHLHDEDCTPPNGYSGAPPGDNKLRLRWYGPLSWSSGDPVTVWYRVHPSQTWIEITADFIFDINPNNPRELVLTPDTPWDLDAIIYRVVPTSNLKCAGVTGAPAVYSLDEYIVDIDF
ncbi:MAG: hypothetical protein ACKVU4_04395 [Phycisphaerales bacterium]